ncbi:hypothetical protein DPMN_055174 [Dreissena polymorpha]|uniref:Uncharacterized protein n=1 Tax=Dreissena polymorpha TaxID=45954 RepID=A0A9D4HTT7_DREPO|nr:hypothetical protein DPMN_055174 [Dreissena polymorpha]
MLKRWRNPNTQYFTSTKEDYIMAGMDNSDYADKSSISGTEGLHYAALVVFQDDIVKRPLSKPPVSNTEISRAHPILKTKQTMSRGTSPYQANS